MTMHMHIQLILHIIAYIFTEQIHKTTLANGIALIQNALN